MLPAIRTVLYATDLSPQGPSIFRYAVELARRHGARIVLLHALEPLGHTATTLVRNVVPAETLARLEREGLADVRRVILERLERFRAQELGADAQPGDLVSEIRVVEGAPDRVILEEARKAVADLIVMGAHGHSGLERTLLGSVANKVVQRSSIPVLLVPIPPAG
jgi:nucleotide-binding universal stress UspA family protein